MAKTLLQNHTASLGSTLGPLHSPCWASHTWDSVHVVIDFVVLGVGGQAWSSLG